MSKKTEHPIDTQSCNQETLNLLCDLHIGNHRQGPGSDATFMKMLELSGIDKKAKLNIADIGCGTGAATIKLLQKTNASLTAVELLPDFLEELSHRAQSAGVQDRLTMLKADMND